MGIDGKSYCPGFILAALFAVLCVAQEPPDSTSSLVSPAGQTPSIRISNVFYETDLRQALDDLSAQAGIPIIADNSIQGYVTMEIINLTLEEALSRILSIGGFSYRNMGDYYLAGSADPGSPTFGLLSETENIPVNYIPAATAVELMSEYYKPYIKANSVLNTVTITGSREMIGKVRDHIRRIDTPPKQVIIEALVTEIKEGALKSIGLDWGYSGKNVSANADLSVGLLDTLNAMFKIGKTTKGMGSASTPFDLITVIRALAQDDKAQIKANPKIVTTNAQPATIYIAKEQYFSVVTGPLNYPYTRLEKVSVGIKLEITPYISENGEITVKIVPEVSDAIGYGREGLPVVDSRKVDTTVRVWDGQTITIGGLTQENVREVRNKIPILGSIPILGYLFSHTQHQKVKTDIVIFITPKIMTELR